MSCPQSLAGPGEPGLARPSLRLVAPQPPLDPAEIDEVQRRLEGADAEEWIRWASERLEDGLVVSTSFGIHSAVMLHLATRVVPEIPVLWVDTGYLPAETYRFAEELTERLALNRIAIQAPMSPARMEALHGRLWESERVEDLDRYDRMRKVEPMRRALREHGATGWLSGLRADQTAHRGSLRPLSLQDGRLKVLPLLDWRARDLHRYLKRHDLPYHPLFEQGYASVGDAHSSRPVQAGDAHERDTRFRGLKQECGLHVEGLDAGNHASRGRSSSSGTRGPVRGPDASPGLSRPARRPSAGPRS